MTTSKRASIKKGAALFSYRDDSRHEVLATRTKDGMHKVQLRRVGGEKKRWALMDTVLRSYGVV